jgi:hypothetical protein
MGEIVDKRAKDARELVLRPEAVEAAFEGLKRRLHENKPANWALDLH